MSIISKIRKFVPKGLKAAAISVAVVVAGMAGLHAVRVHAASTYDCDNNAVIAGGATSVGALQQKYNNGTSCVANGVTYSNKAYSIQDIYHWFGISPSDISAMKTDAVEGTVDKNGNVYVGSTLVATNALTGGRTNISGSTPEKYGATNFFVRKPSVSFLQGSLTAMVAMKNGVFQFAILHACGNPVKATPKKPSYSIAKQVRAGTSGNYGSSVSVKSGSVVQYQITVSSTGQIPVNNVTVRDSLPSDITYTAGTLKENSAAVSAANASKFFASGLLVPSIKNGAKDIFTFSAVAGKMSDTAATCKAETLNNEGFISAPGLTGQQSGAKVTTQCTPPPPQVTLACTNLTLTAGAIDQNTGNQSYALNAQGSAKNATITSYIFTFGDGKTQTVTTGGTSITTTHIYTPGPYTASVGVTATANGKTFTATSNNCQKNITVKQPTPSTLTCESLTLTPGTVDQTTGDTDYTLKAAASKTNNASIASYVFTFGDGKTQTATTTGTSTTTTHTYAAPGTYNASVTVNGIVNGSSVSKTSANCAGTITVKPPVTPPTPEYACDGLTATPVGTADAEGNLPFSFVTTASASNATITGYTFNFDDNSQPQTVTTGDTKASIDHTYAPGAYNPQVTVTIALSDGTTKQVTAAACATKITVAPPMCTSPTTGKTYPAGSPECQPPTCTSPTTGKAYPAGSSECMPPTCTATNGQTYPAGSKQCTPPPTTLVNTGPGSMLGLFAGASALGTVAYRFFLSRRLVR